MRWAWRVFVVAFAILVLLPTLLILLFRFLPVPGTPQMALDLVTGNEVRYRWRAYDRISPI